MVTPIRYAITTYGPNLLANKIELVCVFHSEFTLCQSIAKELLSEDLRE